MTKNRRTQAIAIARSIVAATLLSAVAAAQSSTTLKLVGLDGATKSLGIAELQALPQGRNLTRV